MNYIKVGVAHPVLQLIQDTTGSESVTIEIRKVSDGLVFSSGAMTYFNSSRWIYEFTPDTVDTYVVTAFYGDLKYDGDTLRATGNPVPVDLVVTPSPSIDGSPIVVSDFKSYYDRDFIYGTQKNTIRDKDITNAILMALSLFNPGLFEEALQATVFYPLVAHCLVKAINAGGGLDSIGQGIGSTGSGVVNNKSAGGMSVSYTIPTDLAEDPILNDLLTTGYGRQYLQVLVPNLIGNVGTAESTTNP